MRLTSHKLLFQKPTFQNDVQITVRAGIKWSRRLVPGMTVTVAVTYGSDIGEAYIVGVLSTTFDEIPYEILYREHDPECRGRDGLLAEMQRIYPAFAPTDAVTVLFFKYTEGV